MAKDSSPKFGVQASPFTDIITIGSLNSTGTAFLTGREEATDMVLFAVAQYAKQNFNGGMSTEFAGAGLKLEVIVTELNADERD